jgi:Iron-dependent Transcriptional regulator
MRSKKSHYAFKALAYLTGRYGKGPIRISEISKKRKIPLKFPGNILLELKRSEILDSKKEGVWLLPSQGPFKDQNGPGYPAGERADCHITLCETVLL